jgi:hypothetical protein
MGVAAKPTIEAERRVGNMPAKDGTGPAGSGPRDGRGQGVGGKGYTGTRKGKGAKSGGKKGGCK